MTSSLTSTDSTTSPKNGMNVSSLPNSTHNSNSGPISTRECRATANNAKHKLKE